MLSRRTVRPRGARFPVTNNMPATLLRLEPLFADAEALLTSSLLALAPASEQPPVAMHAVRSSALATTAWRIAIQPHASPWPPAAAVDSTHRRRPAVVVVAPSGQVWAHVEPNDCFKGHTGNRSIFCRFRHPCWCCACQKRVGALFDAHGMRKTRQNPLGRLLKCWVLAGALQC